MSNSTIPPRPSAQQVTTDSGESAARKLVKEVAKKVASDKRISGALALWIFGLLAVFVIPAPVKVTEENAAAFQKQAAVAVDIQSELYKRMASLQEASIRLSSEAGWFPWFASAKEKARVKVFRDRHAKIEARVQEKQTEYNLAERAANRNLGLFSSYGIQRTRDHFWQSFQRGKVIGRQNTLWDGFFMIIGRSRDFDTWLEMVANLAVYLVVNMSTAMFLMFWFFVFGLPGIIWSYGASWASGTAFFVIAVLGAASVMTTFVTLLAGATAGTVYGLYTISGTQLRLGDQSGGRRQRLQGQAMPGYRHTQVGRDHYYRPVRAHDE